MSKICARCGGTPDPTMRVCARCDCDYDPPWDNEPGLKQSHCPPCCDEVEAEEQADPCSCSRWGCPGGLSRRTPEPEPTADAYVPKWAKPNGSR